MTDSEEVDIVNENDEVIGHMPKIQAHIDGSLHRTVIAEIIGSDGKWTLVQQAPDRQDKGQYVSPVGGHVRSRESENEALLREAEEEFGLKTPYVYKLIGKKIFNRTVNNRIENHYFILYEIFTDKEPLLNEESVGFERFSIERLKQELLTQPKKFGDAFHFVIREFYAHVFEF